MTTLESASMVICVCCIICSILSLIAPLGKMKKISGLVFGAFIIASMIMPIKGLCDSFSTDYGFFEQDIEVYDISDSDYDETVLKHTADNLVNAADNLLKNENIYASNIELSLKKTDNNSIYISYINIYITKDYLNRVQDIKNIIGTNMSKEPVITQIE